MPTSHVQKDVSSRLLRLPAEVRLQIYGHLFTSTRLAHGQRMTSRINSKRMKPAPNSLAILRSCRLISREIGDSWLGQVMFAFEEVRDLLDKLSSVPRTVVEKIRRVRVGSHPLMLSPPDYEDDVYYRLAWALKLLPGLNLDTLTVINSDCPEVSYDTLSGLVKHGDGWRELHYITGNSTMLGFPRMDIFLADPYWRKPQPSTWSRDLAQRDGVDAGGCVKIYRSTQSNIPCSVINPKTREIFEQKPPSRENLETFGVDKDAQLMRPDEVGKGLLVTVRRGKNVNTVEDVSVPLHEDDIRQWSGDMSWEEIKEACRWDSDSDDDFGFPEEKEKVESDSYNDADEYTIITLK
ncbi:uncharacterized protein KD926_003384 [Aspergillus affinis]|uniref:uncharacterized protein n=1 Tax=Aspergillus affinis TaxID=1070780 RepID=UPI0022FEB26C|nr:uncharacterized protein KD926_003384 [Aspergillus affinis]KAI9043614.1 hypothetical protein KD926_003384 [Aspergillus affinis]